MNLERLKKNSEDFGKLRKVSRRISKILEDLRRFRKDS